jgi:hypothetical protein
VEKQSELFARGFVTTNNTSQSKENKESRDKERNNGNRKFLFLKEEKEIFCLFFFLI